MSEHEYFVDNTLRHLTTAAEYAVQKEQGDLSIQILVQRDGVMVRACTGGIIKTWMTDECSWEKLATEHHNPLVRMIDGLLFRADRHCLKVAGSSALGIETADGGQEEQHPAGS